MLHIAGEVRLQVRRYLRQSVHEFASAYAVEEAYLLVHKMTEQPVAQTAHDPFCCAVKQPVCMSLGHQLASFGKCLSLWEWSSALQQRVGNMCTVTKMNSNKNTLPTMSENHLPFRQLPIRSEFCIACL